MEMLYTNCMDCPHHRVENDPDPTDSFCNDDQAVLCNLTENIDLQHRWCDDYVWEHRPITWSCRPHHKRVECDTPSWCPLLISNNNSQEEISTPCVCEGNWREIIKETQGKIGKTFVDHNKKEWILDGILWAEDDFYYLFANSGELKYCSCVATLNVHGMKEKE